MKSSKWMQREATHLPTLFGRGSPLEPCHDNKVLPAHQFTRGAKSEVTFRSERSGIHSCAQHFDVHQNLANMIIGSQQACHSSI